MKSLCQMTNVTVPKEETSKEEVIFINDITKSLHTGTVQGLMEITEVAQTSKARRTH